MFMTRFASILKARFTHDLSGKPALWLAAVVVAGFLAFYWDAMQSNASVASARTPEEPEAAATFIPAGFVLVPIEVANFESLDSILGKFGVVDLYIPADGVRKRPIKVAEHIRILRAPLNPSHFAVLAPENESVKLVTYAGPFMVVVQSAKTSGTKFVNAKENDGPGDALNQRKKPRHSRIQIEGNENDKGESDDADTQEL